MHTGTGRILLAAFLLLLGLAALRDFARLGDALPWHAMDDFPDFFCAGDALDAGQARIPTSRCMLASTASTPVRPFAGASLPPIQA